MKYMLMFIVVLVLGVSAGLIAMNDPGYVVISRAPWVMETSLSMFVAIMIAAFLVFYGLIRFIVNSLHLSGRMRQWQHQRRASKARLALTEGLIALAEKNWKTAERKVTRYIDDSDTPLINYLAAASAAQEQSAHERRDEYLVKAHKSMPSANIAIGMTQAELQIRHQQTEQALATLMRLRKLAPRHTHVLKLLMELYLTLKDWAHLKELLPDLKKLKVVDEQHYHSVELKVFSELLKNNITQDKQEAVDALWAQAPKRLHTDAGLLCAYVEYLNRHGKGVTGEILLREALKKHWHDDLVYLYGLTEGKDANNQLLHAEKMLGARQKNPLLLLTLGRLSARNRLWGKARAYLEACINNGGPAEAYQALGDLLEMMNEHEAATEYYRKGLALAADGEGLGVSNEEDASESRKSVVTSIASAKH